MLPLALATMDVQYSISSLHSSILWVFAEESTIIQARVKVSDREGQSVKSFGSIARLFQSTYDKVPALVPHRALSHDRRTTLQTEDPQPPISSQGIVFREKQVPGLQSG